jgi:hypothetical protein
MKQFDIKKGWFSKIEGDLLPELMKGIFGNVKTEGDTFVSNFGVMDRIAAKVVSKAVLEVDTVNKSGTFSDDEILGSKRALNKFLEEATGFDAKTRMKREQKKAKEGKI